MGTGPAAYMPGWPVMCIMVDGRGCMPGMGGSSGEKAGEECSVAVGVGSNSKRLKLVGARCTLEA